MTQILLALRWYLIVQIFGLAALPLSRAIFRRLPDRGYTASKALGLLLTAWVFWLMTSFGWTANTVGAILAALAIVAVAGSVLYHRVYGGETSFSPRWRVIVVSELLFGLTFAGWCVVRSRMPRIQTAGGEKWMEITFLRAILRADRFPPHDPWLSGFAISYYYFGYVMTAMVTRLSAVPPSIAFNLGSAGLFALTCTGAFGLVYNLLALDRTADGAGPVLGGLLGPLLVTVVGNLEGFLEMLHARGLGPTAFWQWLDIRNLDSAPPPFAEGRWIPQRFFWWWQASRVVRDYAPGGAAQEVIDEFPAFSFILGDMHPHVLALPFVLLALALAWQLYLAVIGREGWTVRLQGETAWRFLVYAVGLGGLGFLNTWDFPIYLFVVVSAYLLALLQVSPRRQAILRLARWTFNVSWFAFCLLRAAVLFVALALTGVLLYLPFWIGFQSQAAGILLNLFNATRAVHFAVMFGPLLFVVVAFAVDQARQSGVRWRAVARWTMWSIIALVGALTLVLAGALLLVGLDVIPADGIGAYLNAWLHNQPLPGFVEGIDVRGIIARRVLLHLLAAWTAFGLIALLVTIARSLIRRFKPASPEASTEASLDLTTRVRRASSTFVLLLAATGALLTLSVEYVYLRDHFGARMNTVFKFYFQAWATWGVAAAYALARFIHSRRRWAVAAAGLLIAAGLIYPVLAIPARAREYSGPPTLDGAAYLSGTHPEDYAAIAWLNQHIEGAPVILEAPADERNAYVYEGRVSAHTGLPTLLGWAGHEHQWRGTYDEQARRSADIETLYTSLDTYEVRALLEKYDVRYVYVGPIERARYPAAGLNKFNQLLEPVYEIDSVTIYQVQYDR
jgi:YYY domain-containing protein